MKTIRAFIAIELSEEVRQAINSSDTALPGVDSIGLGEMGAYKEPAPHLEIPGGYPDHTHSLDPGTDG